MPKTSKFDKRDHTRHIDSSEEDDLPKDIKQIFTDIKIYIMKFRIRETPNLSTDADSSTAAKKLLS